MVDAPPDMADFEVDDDTLKQSNREIEGQVILGDKVKFSDASLEDTETGKKIKKIAAEYSKEVDTGLFPINPS